MKVILSPSCQSTSFIVFSPVPSPPKLSTTTPSPALRSSTLWSPQVVFHMLKMATLLSSSTSWIPE